ncbi:MAG: 2-oxo acid dehydrogenase subunit E2 [Saprospiraceae bacterium]|nr:2-oxo acid dehydrogenase subunit E2 [Saprospiraceae bacterium]MBK7737388.1 2-oxo acid dehydrogenase subunit E2 [Saprospiraceae bacterium]MBK7914032.1 2-oxo acid dehydrogenase subunit E2 [Saprospiraceae bacterium]
MAIAIKMPRLSDTMQEGFIKTWNKKVGDTVKPGDILAEVETDKATMDLEAYQDGVLLHIAVNEGAVPVDGIIAIIGQKGENFDDLLGGSKQVSSEPQAASKSPEPQAAVAPAESQTMPPEPTDTRIKASPLAKSLAKEKGLSLEHLSGSGEQGRIVKRDVENLANQVAKPGLSTSYVAPAQQGDREVINSQMRKTIARRLSESKFTAPHFYLTTEVDMDACVEARNQLNAVSPQKISYNDLIVKACAIALRSNLAVNVSWTNDKMIYHNDIHIGIAVAIEDGLVVPVVRNTDQKTLTHIKDEIQDKATRAKERKLNLDEMQGNTFTISNLGMFDIEHFTAIINPPDACILAIGSIQKKAAVKNDNLVISNRMKMTLSCDHRAVDGASGAKFLQSLKTILENPISMLL